MMEEFKLAVEKESVVIPIGCTGYMSKVIWDKVMGEPYKYYGKNEELINCIEKLGEVENSNYNNLIELVMKIIKIIRDKRRKRL